MGYNEIFPWQWQLTAVWTVQCCAFYITPRVSKEASRTLDACRYLKYQIPRWIDEMRDFSSEIVIRIYEVGYNEIYPSD